MTGRLNPYRCHSHTRGFTLIELLVVIAIIALLAAILFPVFARARENARRASCQSNLKQLALGIHQYVQDYDEALPVLQWAHADGGPQVIWTGSNDSSCNTGWPDEIQPYIKSTQILKCPSDKVAGRYASNCGADGVGTISYGMNGCLNGQLSSNGGDQMVLCSNGATGYPYNKFQRMSGITQASKVMMLADKSQQTVYTTGMVLGTYVSSWAYSNYYAVTPALADANDGNSIAGQLSCGYCDTTMTSAGRHFGGANIGFVDGHVKYYGAKTPGLVYKDLDPTATDRFWNPATTN